MPLILAHGLPKSGSTFLAQVAIWAAAFGNGFGPREFKKKFLADSDSAHHFVVQPTDELIDRVERQLPEGKYYVLKTHGSITPRIRERVLDQSIKAFTSFRDPRDCVISLLDAGERARALGGDRAFTNVTNVKTAMMRVKASWATAREWANCDGVLAIPYYLIVTEKNHAVELICHHIGLGEITKSVQNMFKQEEILKNPQYNKGFADRFLEDLAPTRIKRITSYLREEIRESDELTRQRMTELGYRLIHKSMVARRESVLAAMPDLAI